MIAFCTIVTESVTSKASLNPSAFSPAVLIGSIRSTPRPVTRSVPVNFGASSDGGAAGSPLGGERARRRLRRRRRLLVAAAAGGREPAEPERCGHARAALHQVTTSEAALLALVIEMLLELISIEVSPVSHTRTLSFLLAGSHA